MTEQDFLALEPWEQDALVAETFFGWRWWTFGPSTPRFAEKLMFLRDSAFGKWQETQTFVRLDDTSDHTPSIDALVLVPEFTKKIAAAWTVVGEIRLPGFVQVRLESDGADWLCAVGEDVDRAPEVRAPEAPLAICLAALKAVGAIK